MLRRPINKVKEEKNYSYTDIDVESGGDSGSSCSTTIAFKLTGLLKKQWQSFTDTNFAICQESTDFVVANKPTFDKEKLKLIQLSTFIESDITCGTVTAFRARSRYEGPLLNNNTFSPDWNQDSQKINELVAELNRQIERDNLLASSGSSLSASTAFTSCFGGPAIRGGRDRDRDDMRPMPLDVSQKTVAAFVRNPRLFFQTPLHVALLCVLCLAAVGLVSTLSLLLAALSFGALAVIAAAVAFHYIYTRREVVARKLQEMWRSAGAQEARGVAAHWLAEASALVQRAGTSASKGRGVTAADA